METGTIYFIIGIVIIAAIAMYSMWRGGKYIGAWIIHGATGEKLYVYRTRSDARNDSKETMQFHLIKEEDASGRITAGGNCVTIIPTHWITRMDWFIENIENK